MKVVSLSENAVVVLFEQSISKQTANEVNTLRKLIDKELCDVIIDVIPSYTSIHLSFKITKISHRSFVDRVLKITKMISKISKEDDQQKHIEIPVLYGEKVGFDLKNISVNSGLSIQQVIQAHCSKTYHVYALGFSPGFAYLGKIDSRIITPRKETPRTHVPKGSLGIAGEQTALYPSDSPGGWNIIGRTPIDLVNYELQPPCIVQVGDSIKFVSISQSEFLELGGIL